MTVQRGRNNALRMGDPNVATLRESYASRLILVKAAVVDLFDGQHLPLIYPPS